MYDPEQLVEVTWNNSNKKHYMELGYEYTKKGDIFIAKAKDLIANSNIHIDAVCDYCGKEKHVTMLQYNQNTKYGKTKYSCGDIDCRTAKVDDLYGEKRKIIQYKKFVDKCEENNYKPISLIEDYINGHSKMIYECPKHGEKTIDYSDFVYSDQNCFECSLEKQSESFRLSSDILISRVESKNNNKIINPEDYVNFSTKNLKIVCGMCGEIFTSSLSNLENGDGACRECSILKAVDSRRLKSEEVKNIIESINGNILLNPEDYIKNNVVNLRIKCKCGNIFTTSLSNYTYANKTRCDYCTKRISSGEILIRNILDNYNIDYIPEYIFKDCKDKRALPFDFYLPYYNCCIEFDGITHYKPIYGDETFNKRVLHDQMKNQYCYDHNIKIIRIPYFESDNAEQIIIKELNLKEKQLA